MPAVTIHDILAQFREEELHNRILGDRFERLICRYLELDPLFADRFSNIWMWNEWPKKGNTGDIGIDIVAEERATGDFCAIQCKFYLPEHTLSKDDIDSYLNALGDKRFTTGIIVSTTDKWGANAEKSLLNRDKPVNRLRVQDLDDTHVADVARAVGLAVQWQGTGSAVLNVGTGQNHSVMELLAAAAKSSTPILEHQAPHPADVPATLASIRAVGAELGWQPRIFFPNVPDS